MSSLIVGVRILGPPLILQADSALHPLESFPAQRPPATQQGSVALLHSREWGYAALPGTAGGPRRCCTGKNSKGAAANSFSVPEIGPLLIIKWCLVLAIYPQWIRWKYPVKSVKMVGRSCLICIYSLFQAQYQQIVEFVDEFDRKERQMKYRKWRPKVPVLKK